MAYFDFDALRKYTLDVVTDLAEKRLTKAKGLVRKAARAEANSMFHWLAQEMRSHLDAPPKELLEFVPSWADLTDHPPSSYFDYKVNKSGGTQDFFHDKGDLANQFDALSPARIFGDPEGAYNDGPNKKRTFPLNMSFEALGSGRFHVVVDLFPRLPANAAESVVVLAHLVANGSSNPNKTWGSLMNAGNPGGVRRPLLAPALLYYMKHRIPFAVRLALREAGFKVENHG